jgi:hypothetical protein
MRFNQFSAHKRLRNMAVIIRRKQIIKIKAISGNQLPWYSLYHEKTLL